MKQGALQIRAASVEDAAALLNIYAPYVKKTAVTFEYEVPSVEEFAERIQRILKKYPYLVAETDRQIVGYAYAGPFHERAAYGWAVETTVYVDENSRGMGIGRKLYESLEGALAAQNILNLYACIAYPAEKDAYLNKDSVLFHQKLGYRLIGEFHECGYKFNRWYHMVWMEKQIGQHVKEQPPVKEFSQVLQLYQIQKLK